MNTITVEQRGEQRFVVLLNGNVVVECRTQADVDDFLRQWQQQAKPGSYRIKREAVRLGQSKQKSAANRLLLEDPLAAEVYLVQAAAALHEAHGWREAEVEQLCRHALSRDREAIEARQGLPPRQTVAYRQRQKIFGLF